MQNIKILFSPSENKTLHGTGVGFDPSNLLFGDDKGVRADLTKRYDKIMNSGDEEAVSALTGLKKYEDSKEFRQPIEKMPLVPAIERYVGVAYDYLAYDTLDPSQKEFIQKYTLIFSNLFGAILAADLIPPYKFKQGEKLEGINTATLYKKHFSSALDEYLANSLIVDLRAGYYEKFYAPKKQVIGMKFLKGGTSVSHWAKAWRGLMLRNIAQEQPSSLEEIIAMQTQGVSLIDRVESAKKIELVYEIEA